MILTTPVNSHIQRRYDLPSPKDIVFNDKNGNSVNRKVSPINAIVGLTGIGFHSDIPPPAYEKMQTGVTQATFAAISAFHDFQLYEVSDYVLDVPFGAGGHPILINKNTWNKIFPKDRQIMMELALEGTKRSHQALADLNYTAWKEMVDKGMRVIATREERKLWEDQFKLLWEEWITQLEASGVKEAREIFNFWKNASDKVLEKRTQTLQIWIPQQDTETILKLLQGCKE